MSGLRRSARLIPARMQGIRERLTKLRELTRADEEENPLGVLAGGILQDEILKKHKIVRVNFDLEGFDFRQAKDLKPPFFAVPEDPRKIKACPINVWFTNPEDEESTFDFENYNPNRRVRGGWRVEDSAREVSKYLQRMAFDLPTKGDDWATPIVSKMEPVCYPHPFYSETALSGRRHGTQWRHSGMWEFERSDGMGPFPHLTITTLQSCDAMEDSMLLGELAMIVQAMSARAHQAKVTKEGKELYPRQFQYEDEARFSVLMLSFSGPQHGRIFYACLHDDYETIFVRQSPLYSFKERDSAPWDLFRRIMLSVPIDEGK